MNEIFYNEMCIQHCISTNQNVMMLIQNVHMYDKMFEDWRGKKLVVLPILMTLLLIHVDRCTNKFN